MALDLDARPGVRDRPGLTFTPGAGEGQLPPSGARGRARANLDAIRLLGLLADQEREATSTERAQLTRWSGWGAVAELFDEQRQEWQHDREQLRALVGEDGYAQARRTTINAHYTHPAIAAAMWQLAGALGFAGGEVIEPGCGAGVFIGLAPQDARMVGVELDATTAQVAEHLYPHAKIVSRSFAEPSRGLREGRFALAIGNVPFAKVTLYDPEHNRSGHAIHNHFIVKSLALLQPGGLAVLLTSRYTLDAANPAARREMSQLADLLGALRLHGGVHRRVAGTEAVTDLLVFRRRPAATGPADETWVRTQEVDVDGTGVRINSYLAEHPGQVLGALKLGRGLYDSGELVVEQLADVPALAEPAASVSPRTPVEPEPAPAVRAAPEGLWDGHLLALPDGAFAEVRGGVQVSIEPPRATRAELRMLLVLRDRARALLAAEAASAEDTPAIDQLRSRVHQPDGTSRMSREAHVRICGGPAGEIPAGYPAGSHGRRQIVAIALLGLWRLVPETRDATGLRLRGAGLALRSASPGAGAAHCGLLKRFDRRVPSFLSGFQPALGLDEVRLELGAELLFTL